MEIISKVSKGSRMDQIYLSKNRSGLEVGTYVQIRALQRKQKKKQFQYYHVRTIEPLKVRMLQEVFTTIDSNIDHYENIIITGSFLNNGFNFNDIDVILLTKQSVDTERLETILKRRMGVKTHFLVMDYGTFINGINTDPLYQTMISKCVSLRRVVFNIKPKINYKILDLHLLKSRLFVEHFDYLNGNEKYGMIRNLMAILLFIKKEQVTTERINQVIEREFGKGSVKKIKENVIVDKRTCLTTFKRMYKKTEAEILKNAAKQKQAH